MNSRERVAAVLLVAVTLLLRTGVLWQGADQLPVDVDAYLGIAHSLAVGDGYSSPGTHTPTAYRPPLYPVVLAGILKLGGGATAVALVHLLLGTLTVWLTLVAGRRLGLGPAAFAAAGLVAFDPLLLRYTALPMTETVFTFLVVVLLAMLVRNTARGLAGTATGTQPVGVSLPSPECDIGHRPFRQAVIGFVFGLCALCRPTIWTFGLVASVWWAWKWTRCPRFRKSQGSEQAAESRPACPWPLLLAVGLTVSPWLVRNVVVFGRPILNTTHGGYTLLLGNNPVFYSEVVDQPWGTVWREESLRAWNQTLQDEMKREVPPVTTEPERDRWMYRRAWKNITTDKSGFARACWLRLRRFWNVAPLGPSAESLPAPARWVISSFYVLIMIGFLVGLARLKQAEWRVWMPLILLVLSFCIVHLFFWSNTRMRAPLIPAIALLAARGWLGRWRASRLNLHWGTS